MVPGCKQLLRQVDAFSAFKRKGRENVTNATLASFVLASTAVIIPHFHVGNVCFFFVFFLLLVLKFVFLPFICSQHSLVLTEL